MWVAEVSGERLTLQALDSDRIEGSPLQEVDGVYRLNPARFEGLQGPSEARYRGERLLESLRIYQALYALPPGQIGLGHLREVVDGAPTIHHVAVVEGLMFSSSLVSIQLGDGPVVYAKHSSGPSFDRFEIAFQSGQLGGKLQGYLTQPLNDWTNLARIIELIKHAVGGAKMLEARGWVSQKELKRFDHTTNHPSSGPTSRHSADRTLPPDIPMTLAEEKSLALSLARHWLLDQESSAGST
ncbi:MAG: hypothetical protein GAK31_01025 [Stenotrophomonas maltophilia]|uniref:Uncharacterized protein n=1 Tax=Stenotrophomonas maltophilia TaxID=40324 RepID=A0A7V8JLZ3_STEMA|nr:MAG: hypothetical protein GAK31_01025 [Stenotrophomonas maltophilia]